MRTEYPFVESPFECRYCCWFCGEPAADTFSFPTSSRAKLTCAHPSLSLSCCAECCVPAKKSKQPSIWQVRMDVKKHLISHNRKDLAIGVNWTKEELENSGFENGNFAGFQRSAWMMYEIAKARVNYKGWSLVVDGLNIEQFKEQDDILFVFDGISYPSIIEAISHYSKLFDLHHTFFERVLQRLGTEKFAQAVSFCRLHVGCTPDERQRALQQLSKR